MSPEFIKQKQFPVPGRGFLASAILLLAIAGAIGAWFFVSYSWRIGCEGAGAHAAPAAASRQAFRCQDLGQRDARLVFAGLALVGLLVAGIAARRWMFGKLPQVLLVIAVLLPVVFPYFGFLVATHPADTCDHLGRADLKAAIGEWKDSGQHGTRPDFCDRV